MKTINALLFLNLIAIGGWAGIASKDLFIPAVSNTPGQNNTLWTSDVRIYNPNAGDVIVTMTYTPMAALGGSVQTHTYPVPAMATRNLTNILGNLFGLDHTAGSLHLTAPAGIEAESRTWTPGAVGSYGQRIPAIPAGQALAAGNSTDLLYIDNSPDSSTGFRTNLGVMDASGAGSTAHLQAYDENGNAVGTSYPLTLGAYELQQTNGVLSVLGVGTGSNYRVTVTADTGSVISYASQVDNASGDPIFVDGSVRGSCADGSYYGFFTLDNAGAYQDYINGPLLFIFRNHNLLSIQDPTPEDPDNGDAYPAIYITPSQLLVSIDFSKVFDPPLPTTEHQPFVLSFSENYTKDGVVILSGTWAITGQTDCDKLSGSMSAMITAVDPAYAAYAGSYSWHFVGGKQ